jgi:hypothetical protein
VKNGVVTAIERAAGPRAATATPGISPEQTVTKGFRRMQPRDEHASVARLLSGAFGPK